MKKNYPLMNKTKINYDGIIGLNNFPIYYINIPKSACTTIKNILFIIDNNHMLDDPLSIHKAIRAGRCLQSTNSDKNFNERISKRQFVFTFIRDPLQRSYSCFNEKIISKGKYSFPWIRNYLLKHGYINQDVFIEDQIDIIQYRLAFLGFLKFVSDNINGLTHLKLDPHWGLQSRVILIRSRSLNIDFIGRVSNFKNDFEYVLKKIKINNFENLTDLHFNEGPTPRFSLKEIFNDEITNKIMTIYKKDYDYFGYF